MSNEARDRFVKSVIECGYKNIDNPEAAPLLVEIPRCEEASAWRFVNPEHGKLFEPLSRCITDALNAADIRGYARSDIKVHVGPGPKG